MTSHDPQAAQWFEYVDRVVRSDDPPPFDDQWRRYAELSARRPADLGPLPAWRPDTDTLTRANLTAFMEAVGAATYADLHRWSVTDRMGFWQRAIERVRIPLETPAAAIMGRPDDVRHPAFLDGARLDIIAACFQAESSDIAVVAGREGDPDIQRVTFGELETLVNRIAGAVRALDLAPDQGVALYMPMTVECVASYLGVIRAGRHVVSIADSFAAEEVAGACAWVTPARSSR
jgi:acetyl-CoA synthetase